MKQIYPDTKKIRIFLWRPAWQMFLLFQLFHMHTCMDAKREDVSTKIERVTCRTVFANKLTAQSETNSLCRKKFCNFAFPTHLHRAHLVANIVALSGCSYAYLNRCKARRVKSRWFSRAVHVCRQHFRVQLAKVKSGICSTKFRFFK